MSVYLPWIGFVLALILCGAVAREAILNGRRADQQQRRAERHKDRAAGWRTYAKSLEQRGNDETLRRNEIVWLTEDGKALLDRQFEEIVGGGM